MAVANGAILRVVASLLLPDSVIAQNIFYLVFADTGSSNEDDDVIADIVTYLEDMYAEIVAQVADDVTTDEVKVYIYDHAGEDWDEVGTDTWDVSFTSVNDMFPHGVACVLHARTIDPDVTATKYIAGFNDGMALDSDLIASGITALGAFNDVWVTGFAGTATGGDFACGVWSTVADIFKPFNGNHVVNGVVGYQRRRKPGVGI